MRGSVGATPQSRPASGVRQQHRRRATPDGQACEHHDDEATAAGSDRSTSPRDAPERQSKSDLGGSAGDRVSEHAAQAHGSQHQRERVRTRPAERDQPLAGQRPLHLAGEGSRRRDGQVSRPRIGRAPRSRRLSASGRPRRPHRRRVAPPGSLSTRRTCRRVGGPVRAACCIRASTRRRRSLIGRPSASVRRIPMGFRSWRPSACQRLR